MKKLKQKILSSLLFWVCFAIGVSLVPYQWCAREAETFYHSPKTLMRLQRGVENWVNKELTLDDFTTGSSHFNGEWLFGTYVMGGLGFCQMAELHPETHQHNLPLIERCIDQLLSKQVRSFDLKSWKVDAIESLDSDNSDHAAYLGYFNLLLSYNRLLNPDTKYARLNDRVTNALARRLNKSKIGLLYTYPGELYPVDNCAVIGSIALYDKATGADHSDLINNWVSNCRERYIDAKTGLLIQSVRHDGSALDKPRGSGTTLGLYFLSFIENDLAKELYVAVKKELADTLLNFGVVREYSRSEKKGGGDIDSGPIVFGYGFSATGFYISGTRIFNDFPFYKRLFATSYLAGAPSDDGKIRSYVTAGPLGDAILLAMFSAKTKVVK